MELRLTGLVVLALAVVLAAGFLVDDARCDQFVKVAGNQFTVDGTVYKIKGANYYSASAPWAAMFGNWNWNEISSDIDTLHSLGVNSIRINLPYSSGGWGGPNVNATYLDRLERLVEYLRARGMRANITMFDWETSFPAAGTAKEAEHKAYVNAIVGRLRNNPGVFLWDVKNEPDHPSNIGGYDNWDYSPANRDKIVSWLNRMCQYVRSIDPNHPAGAGIRWYENVSDVIGFVDVAIFHNYWDNVDTVAIPTAKAASGDTKPVLIQEFGWPSQPHPCWRGQWIYDYTEQRQLEMFQMNLNAFAHHDIAGGIMWQACDLAPYVSDPNGDTSVTFENYFGLWRTGRNLKPAGIYYRDHWPVEFFPYSDTTVPVPPTSASALGLDRAIRVTWTHSASPDCAGAMVRCSTSGYPTSPTSGTLVATVKGEGTAGGSCLHSGLQRDTTYYYSVFAYDYAGNYSSRITTSAKTLYQPTNLLAGPAIDSFVSGVADGWTSYERYPGGDAGPISFAPDSAVSISGGLSQAISGLGTDALSISPGGFAHAGIVQAVPAVPGRTYVLVGYEAMTAPTTGRLYFRTFGIDPTGSLDPGSPGEANVGGAKWMGDGALFWNDDPGASNATFGMYRCVSAVTASSPTISCWAGIGVSLVEGRRSTDKINYDSFYLHEFESPIGSSLSNGGFEGSVLDCLDADLHIPDGWTPAGGGCGRYLGYTVSSSVGLPRTGGKCAAFLSYPGKSDLGLMQRVEAYPGEMLSASVYVRGVPAGTASTSAAIGIDPTGGTDMFADTVVWSTIVVGNNTTWRPVSVSATGRSSGATVFVRASSGDISSGYHTVYADDVSFSASMATSCPAQLRALPDGRSLTLRGCIVTAAFGGYFYVEDAARTSGIRVLSTTAVSVGQMVDVTGTMTTVNGERCVQNGAILAASGSFDIPAPYAMACSALGGAPCGYCEGIDGSCGPVNLGLLVRTWGRVADTTPAHFTIDDGSGRPIRVYSSVNPANGAMVVVTGISSCEIPAGGSVPVSVVRTRFAADVVGQ